MRTRRPAPRINLDANAAAANVEFAD